MNIDFRSKERRFVMQRMGLPTEFQVYDYDEKRIVAVCPSLDDSGRIAAALVSVANTAKVLADLKPEFRCVYSQNRQKLENAYSSDQVSALIAERNALKAQRQQLHTMLSRYVNEVPTGHQPHMAGLEAEELLKATS